MILICLSAVEYIEFAEYGRDMRLDGRFGYFQIIGNLLIEPANLQMPQHAQLLIGKLINPPSNVRQFRIHFDTVFALGPKLLAQEHTLYRL